MLKSAGILLVLGFVGMFWLNIAVRGGDSDISSQVQELVRKQYIHGVPEADARGLDSAAVVILGNMMKDTDEMEYWPNIVEVLGYIGGDSSREVLVEFLSTRKGAVKDSEFKALLLVPSALGQIAAAGDGKSRLYLEALTNLTSSPARQFEWFYESYRGARLVNLLAEVGVNGLGLIDAPESETFLRQLKRRVSKTKSESFLLDEVNSALRRSADKRQSSHQQSPLGGRRPRLSGRQPRCSVEGRTEGTGTRIHHITVSRHANVKIDKEDVGRALGTASILLTNDDGVCREEVACPFTFEMVDELGTFGIPSDGHDVITTEDELREVLSGAVTFRVVVTLAFCFESGNVPGCTFGDSSVIEQAASSRADLWAHEFGHIRGLPDADEPCAGRIMNGGSRNTSAVDDHECVCFSRP